MELCRAMFLEDLSPQAQNLYRLLAKQASKIRPKNLKTLLHYGTLHEQLGLDMVGDNYGKSLMSQGGAELSEWAIKNNLPALTSIIVNAKTNLPGSGFWSLYNRTFEDDPAWWLEQVEQTIEFLTGPWQVPISHSTSLDPKHSGINSFFENVLSVKLSHIQQSWGEYDAVKNKVFLRLWIDDLAIIDGQECIRVHYHDQMNEESSRKFGFKKRTQHIKLMQSGVPGFGVILTPRSDPKPNQGRIQSFERDKLWQLGYPFDVNGGTYCPILRTVSLKDVLSDQIELPEFTFDRSVLDAPETTKAQLIKARIGQGKFRTEVLSKWDNCCAVTGIGLTDAIRASHIKPWSECTNDERLDPNNGLPLAAHLDVLFDRGWITFSDEGILRAAKDLSESDKAAFGLDRVVRLRMPLNSKQKTFLSYHKKSVFLDSQ